MKADYEGFSEVLKSIAHPVRLQIIAGLIENECNVSRMQKILNLPQSTISQHLKVLKNSGVIVGRREKTKVCYRVVDNRVKIIIKIINRK